MSNINTEQKHVISSNDNMNWNKEFKKNKLNLRYFNHEDSLNNFVNVLIKLSQISHARSSGKKINDTKCTFLK